MGRGMKFLDSPTGISLDFSGSFEIFWNFVTIFTPIHRDNWGFITGIGLDWRNYVMNDNRYFTKQNGQIKIVPCPEDAHLDFNKNIKVNPINLDIMAQGGYGTFGFYVKLSPFNIMQQSHAPEMRSFSAGVMLHF